MSGRAVSEPPPVRIRPDDVFDDIFALLTPQRLLHDPRAPPARASRVCVSRQRRRTRSAGREIPPRRDRPSHPIEGGIFTADHAEPLPYEGQQSTPHGTTVADIILTLAPRVRLYSADVFGPRGTCEVEVVIRALRWAMDVWKCKVINLSLGVPEQRLQQVQRRQQLLRAIEEAYYKDVLVVAAAHNEHPLMRSYPAAVRAAAVLGGQGSCSPIRCISLITCASQIEFQAHGRGYLGPFAQEPATSWAAPHLTGIAARILSLRPTLETV